MPKMNWRINKYLRSISLDTLTFAQSDWTLADAQPTIAADS